MIGRVRLKNHMNANFTCQVHLLVYLVHDFCSKFGTNSHSSKIDQNRRSSNIQNFLLLSEYKTEVLKMVPEDILYKKEQKHFSERKIIIKVML